MAAFRTKVFFSIASCAIIVTWMITNKNLEPFGQQQFDDYRRFLDLDDIQGTIFEDFNFKSKECGYRKCFFLSKKDNDFGYLTSTLRFKSDDRKAFELAKHMEAEDGIKQPYLDPPQIVALPKSVALILGSHMYENEPEISVYKLRTIKNQAVMVGCEGIRGKSTLPLEKRIPVFIKQAANPTDFYFNLRKSILQTEETMKKNPCLHKDFQIMVDRYGDVYHLDFDRCYQRGGGDRTEEKMVKCFEKLHGILETSRLLAKNEVEMREKLLH